MTQEEVISLPPPPAPPVQIPVQLPPRPLSGWKMKTVEVRRPSIKRQMSDRFSTRLSTESPLSATYRVIRWCLPGHNRKALDILCTGNAESTAGIAWKGAELREIASVIAAI